MNPDLDLGALSMTEIIRLQNLLTQELSRRFETPAAICFTDIVGSTAYFARFGDATGRQLQQLHIDLLQRALGVHGGRIVDTAGDGAVTYFQTAESAAAAMCMLQADANSENALRSREHQLQLRIGIHWGRVLTDGVQVTGDVMNLCSRIASSADPGQIRVSTEAFRELDNARRLRCRPLGEVTLKGVSRALPLLELDWLDRDLFPVAVRVRETDELIELPRQDIVSFGRMDIIEGMAANDVVLSLPESTETRKLSRWHFELRRHTDGYRLRSVTTHPTVVNGQPLQRGDEVPIKPGGWVQLSGVLTLDFVGTSSVEGTRSDVTWIAAT